MEETLKYLIETLNKHSIKLIDSNNSGWKKVPSKCPGCEGSGVKFISTPGTTDRITQACTHCNGNGIVWG
jgi:DnaJ-class molecular chaperone